MTLDLLIIIRSHSLFQDTYEIYTRDAVFHDPVGIAVGVDSIRSQFDALPKVVPDSRQLIVVPDLFLFVPC